MSESPYAKLRESVTAAGINLDKSFTSHTWAETAKMHTINVRPPTQKTAQSHHFILTASQILGTFFTAQLTTAQLLSQNTPGSILLIGSVKAHCAAPGHHLSGYSASKGAIRSLNTDLAVELAPHGIRVNTISPGSVSLTFNITMSFTPSCLTERTLLRYIQTPMNARLQESNPQLAKIMHIASPLQRMGTRNDLTGAAVYLLSEASAYTTGADLVVDGGLSCGRIEGLAV